MISIVNLRKDFEFVKRYKTLFENILEEFKEDLIVEAVELTISNESKEDTEGAIYIDLDINTDGVHIEDIIIRVMGYIRDSEDWVVLNLNISNDTNELLTTEDRVVYLNNKYNTEDDYSYQNTNVTYSLNTKEGISGDYNLTYLNMYHLYGEDYRGMSYELSKVEELTVKQIDKLFTGYELEVVEDLGIY